MAEEDPVLNELCENFAAAYWAKGANDARIEPYLNLFKSGPAAVKALSKEQLSNIQTHLAIWIHEIPDDEGERFVGIVGPLIEAVSEELKSRR